ncbi:helical backbone metal receptor [Kineosporia sp. A_224]|uniref:helical backbone metal receptor n=1 Tax=Kineosporia sp. A_224 TaxID=1962180 RepID=UPI000B4C1FCC|nr:helical backbone metal receptor [Kineosporia sp. A_224]
MRSLVDDTGRDVVVPDDVTRVVSIVPSLTESVAATAPGLLVAATDWCTYPADLDVVRVRGTKNPDVARIVDLAPDLVLANAEENRDPDLDRLRAAGVAVWVTDIRTVSGAHPALGPDGSLARMLDACGLARPGWLDAADAAWAAVRPAAPRRRAVVPIWRRPWMAVGRDTFTGDVLARLGVDNALDGDPERYPKVDLDGLAGRVGGFDVVVLPDEPYLFTADDGPEAFPGVESVLVSGRLLTWYGPSLVDAARDLPGLLGTP